jgi:flagellar M-ring protein FliF
MQKFLNQLKSISARYSMGQKVTAALLVLVLVAGMFFLVTFLGKTRYQVLFSGLDGKDAAAVTKKLDELKVPYQIQGSTILVAANKVDQARIQLAGAGLPAGSKVGFEIFDNSSFGASDFTQKVNYQRALEGELARTIASMDQVQDAVVHIAQPDETLFSQDQQQTTAAVMVTMKAGGTLSGGQVAAVSHLVACSVKGLDANNVTVADSTGALLSGESGGAAMTSEQITATKTYEAAMEAPLQGILDKVIGTGKGVVKVNADLDFTSKTSQVDTYTPAGTNGLPSQQTTSNENYGNGTGTTTGTPGTTSNIPNYTTTTGQTGNGYNKTDAQTTYDNNHTTEQVTQPAGTLKRLSVAVLVDDSVKARNASALRETLSAAAGLDNTRGDVISVQTVQFDNTASKSSNQAAAKAAFWNKISGYAKTGGLVVLALIAAFILWRKLKKARKSLASLPALGIGGGEAQMALGGGSGNALTSPLQLGLQPRSQDELINKARPLLEGVNKPAVLEAIELLASQKPEEVAQMLRATMKEKA